ncbi:MAG: nucleotidyltransferase domain-containing protein [Actinobacteria bacterium]|nr:nucleotidyltransferase domain-containing protein [Actinomycetota bacterium]
MIKENVGHLLKEMLKGVNYKEIILFGSRARGDYSEKSDYDILIVMKNNLTIREKMELSSLLRKKLAKEGIDADLVIKSKEELNYYRTKIGSVVREVLKEGIRV